MDTPRTPTRARRRQRPPGPVITACATAVLLTACGTQDAGSAPTPSAPSTAATTSPTAVDSPTSADGYVQPPFVELPIDTPDRPGDDRIDWRRQVRESIQRHPGTFVVPSQLPADISMAFTSTWWERPVLDVMSDGSGVIVCADQLPACQAALGDAPVVLVRSGEVGSTPFHVLRKPPAEPGTTGELTAEQQQYWATVPFTTAVPDWATETT
ncbi:hypothetical protein [Kineococcus sp. SYSU DK018]|uniref:hypothetical protein n=1 Tax=Kineococcus sp. SYSU DK018 TaxID=3383139 RepID=UPI003D7E53D6